jgi:hypothetical protein
MAGGAAILFLAVLAAGPVLVLADLVAVWYMLSTRAFVRWLYVTLFVLCACGGLLVLLVDSGLWWSVITGRFYDEAGGTFSSEFKITRVVPWAAAFLVVSPGLRYLFRRRF